MQLQVSFAVSSSIVDRSNIMTHNDASSTKNMIVFPNKRSRKLLSFVRTLLLQYNISLVILILFSPSMSNGNKITFINYFKLYPAV